MIASSASMSRLNPVRPKVVHLGFAPNLRSQGLPAQPPLFPPRSGDLGALLQRELHQLGEALVAAAGQSARGCWMSLPCKKAKYDEHKRRFITVADQNGTARSSTQKARLRSEEWRLVRTEFRQ